MELQKLKYCGYSIVCEEVPDEISLAINISGCPHRCEGCHSEYLWEYTGNYISDDLNKLIKQYDSLITCVCFMGGDQNLEELLELCLEVKRSGYKVCIYSGNDDVSMFQSFFHNCCLDYLKIGRYIHSRGGLDKESTNQKMYKIVNPTVFQLAKCGDDLVLLLEIQDITYRFQRRKLNDNN